MNWLATVRDQARETIRRRRHLPTDAERELLGFVARNECYQEDDGRSHTYLSEIFGLSDPWQDVTDDIAEVEAAGWVQLAVSRYARRWELTAAGKRVASKLD